MKRQREKEPQINADEHGFWFTTKSDDRPVQFRSRLRNLVSYVEKGKRTADFTDYADFTEDRKKDEGRSTTKENNIEDPDPSGINYMVPRNPRLNGRPYL